MREVVECGRRAPGRVLAAGCLAAGVAGATLLAGGCGLVNDATTSATAPLTALPMTDVVVETNLETQLTVARAAAATGQPPSGDGFVTGASTGPNITSAAAPEAGTVVLVAYNDVSRDCLGLMVVGGLLPRSVLGETAPGTYYFRAPATPLGACVASGFAAQAAVPAGWPAGDPSSSGFPPS
jgi:hypothetical protein